MSVRNAFEEDTTSWSLLGKVRDTEDRDAWELFVRRYNPLLDQCCRKLKLDLNTSDEVRSRVWAELVVLVPSISRRPGFRFRMWLWKLCRFRAIDLIRRRDIERRHLLSMDEKASAEVPAIPAPADEADGSHPPRTELLAEALDICETVRSRVQEQTWQAFWHIAFEGWTVRETADALKMSYAAVFVAHQRVEKKLRDEGDRRSQG